ncbi:phosphoadenosine phosphosulfate reductase family protein [Halobaculum sp. MBLA0147]|uniref:phosphoadenosine phosphosulfate reductase domain-containing protein n=1 Tax=Halobaculum sp. MBLA0147 TaxID=3079934 RepID=UPI0035262AEE
MPEHTPEPALVSTAKDPDTILESVADKYPDRQTFALVSGGHDSTAAALAAINSPHVTVDAILYIDTGIGVPEAKRWVRAWAQTHDVPFRSVGAEYRRPIDEYHNLVANFGFPGPPSHEKMWINLKDKPLRGFIAAETDDPPVLITGIRKHESDRRAEIAPDSGISTTNQAVYVSPLIDFTDSEIADYREANAADLEVPAYREHDDDRGFNPVTEKLHTSGDCLCGAFGRRDELRELELFYPAVYDYLSTLEGHVVDSALQGRVDPRFALWAHGQDQDGYDTGVDHQQAGLNLCSACSNRADSSHTTEGPTLTHAEDRLHEELTSDASNECGDHLQAYCSHCQTLVDDPVEHRDECPSPPAGLYGNARTWRDIREIDHLESQYRGIWITEPDPTTAAYCPTETQHEWNPLSDDERIHPDTDSLAVCNTCGAYRLGTGATPVVPEYSAVPTTRWSEHDQPGTTDTDSPGDSPDADHPVPSLADFIEKPQTAQQNT